MSQLEYKVIPAPRKPRSSKGAKSRDEAMARAMSALIAEEAQDGWEYIRCDLIVCEERSSWFSKKVEQHRAMLVFRRGGASAQQVAQAPVYAQPMYQPMPQQPMPQQQMPQMAPQPMTHLSPQQVAQPPQAPQFHGEPRGADKASPLPFRPVGSVND